MAEISKMLYDPDIKGRLNYIDIISAEFMHSIHILGHYAHMASVLEICKNLKLTNIKSEPINRAFSDLYIDDIANGLYDPAGHRLLTWRSRTIDVSGKWEHKGD